MGGWLTLFTHLPYTTPHHAHAATIHSTTTPPRTHYRRYKRRDCTTAPHTFSTATARMLPPAYCIPFAHTHAAAHTYTACHHHHRTPALIHCHYACCSLFDRARTHTCTPAATRCHDRLPATRTTACYHHRTLLPRLHHARAHHYYHTRACYLRVLCRIHRTTYAEAVRHYYLPTAFCLPLRLPHARITPLAQARSWFSAVCRSFRSLLDRLTSPRSRRLRAACTFRLPATTCCRSLNLFARMILALNDVPSADCLWFHLSLLPATYTVLSLTGCYRCYRAYAPRYLAPPFCRLVVRLPFLLPPTKPSRSYRAAHIPRVCLMPRLALAALATRRTQFTACLILPAAPCCLRCAHRGAPLRAVPCRTAAAPRSDTAPLVARTACHDTA